MAEEKLSVNQISAIIESQHQKVDDSKRKRTVCVHWLNNQCKKGDHCEYLHVYQEDKIPPCKYFVTEGVCQKGDKCVYRHVNPIEKRTEDCPYYERGFCRMGFFCQLNHIHKKICENYIYGFCPKGPDCDKEHVKSVIADHETTLKLLANFPDSENWADKNALTSTHNQQQQPWMKAMMKVRCHRCGDVGHKSTYCQEEQITPDQLNQVLAMDDQYNMQNQTVLCFKCKRYGHYANVCPQKAQNQAGGLDALGGIGGLKLTAGMAHFNQMVEQTNPNANLFEPNQQNMQGGLDQAAAGYGVDMMNGNFHQNAGGMGGMNYGQPTMPNYGQAMGNQVPNGGNDLTQSLKNLSKLLDGNTASDNNQNNGLDYNQTIKITKVSLNELPLSFDQITHAVSVCVNTIQQEEQQYMMM